jgi:hypothetical protein
MAIVYQHRRKDTAEIFYIGIGKTYNRAYSKSGRNKYWHNIVNLAGYNVEILYHECTIEFAKNLEKTLIKSLGRKCKKNGQLVNITEGGDDSCTTIGRICIHKGDKEKLIEKINFLEYEKDGWILGRSLKSRKSIGISNSKSQLGKKHSKETIEKMRGERGSYKINDEISSTIIDLYNTQKFSIQEISKKVNLSFPVIIKFLKDNRLYKKERPIKECPHCKIKGCGSNMKRYHFDNCKLKKID